MDSADWQLGRYDVADPVIRADGQALPDLLGYRPRNLDDLSQFRHPHAGWRLIHGGAPVPARGELSVVAAPWAEAGPSAWALLHVSNSTGRPSIATTSPVDLRVGRGPRRLGLELVWPVRSLVHRTGGRFAPSVLLRNTTDSEWVGDGRDHNVVEGQLSRPDGEPLPMVHRRSWFAVEAVRQGAIPARGEIALTVSRLDNADPGAVPPGSYLFRAQHMDLQLSTPAIELHVSS